MPMRGGMDGTQRPFSIGIENGERLPDWDVFVSRAPGGDLVQSTAWARFRQAEGLECHRVVARDSATIVGGMQVYARRVGAWRLAYVPYGPLVASEAPQGLVADLVRVLRREVLQRGAVFIQPPLHGEVVAAELSLCGFEPSDVKVAPSATLRLDVARPVDELRLGLSSRLRRYVRQWERKGVEIRPGSRDDLGLLAELHARSARLHGFRPVSRAYLDHLWEALSPEGHVRLLVGSVDSEPMAAELFTSFAGVVSDRIKGFDREHLQARVPAALIWTAMVDAHERGEHWLDFGGVQRAAAVAMLENGADAVALKTKHRFKLSFGPTPVVYPRTVELARGPALQAGFALMRSVKPGRRIFRHIATHMRQGTSSA